MKRQSYKIKHDFLFDGGDDFIDIPQLDSANLDANKLKLSDVLKAKNEELFLKLIDASNPCVVIVDDIGKCINPASERYKEFIIRCVCQKLSKHSINVYL